MGWAKRKGLNPYAVAKTIGRRGTKGIFMFRSTAQEWDRKGNKIEKVIGKFVEKELDK